MIELPMVQPARLRVRSRSRSTSSRSRCPKGSTVLRRLRELGIDTPTLCYGETLTPSQCVPDLRGRDRGRASAGARVLAQSRAGHGDRRPIPPGAPQPQDGDRVPRLLGRPLDHPSGADYLRALRRRIPSVTGRPRRPTPTATTSAPATTSDPTARPRRPSHAPTKVDNDLYVRDYSKCILCYKCVDACGEQYQNTFAITVAGRGFDARISTEYANPLPDSACVYCGNCIAVCPTGALMFALRARAARGGDLGRVPPDADRHDLPVLRRGLQPRHSTSRTTRSSRSPPPTTTTSRAATSASRADSASST